ncbi:MAG: PAS domain S-box protein [Alphaproteobacteria bacterium]|jgi:PAS domain S-box-containing protein|nr:PAS domain S-box protein [Alphaproteobacteria bacterium]|tara:strand:- start:574 stop:3228 length:2655 start_codon:yes stop_codon:yes gene_type:complete
MTQRSDDTLREVLEASPIGIAILERDTGRRLFANTALAKILGAATPDDLIDRDISETWVNSNDLERAFSVIQEGRALVDFEAERKHLNGSRWWALMNSQPLLFEGESAGILWHTDITERKLAEEALRRSEERFASVSENLPGAVYRRVLHTDGSISVPFMSSRSSEIFERESERITQDSDHLLNTMLPEDLPLYIEAVKRSAENLTPLDVEIRFPQEDGEIRWSHSISHPRKLENGDIVWDGIAFDITERKQAEAALLEANLHRDAAIESFSDGFVLYDNEDRFVLCNTAYRNSHPMISEIQVPGEKFETIVRKLAESGFYGNSADEIEEVVRERLERFQSGQSFEYRMADGRWFQMNQYDTRDAGKALVRIDITERKRAEEALRESEARYRQLVQLSPDAVVVHRSRKFLMVNPAALEIFRVREERDLIGKPLADYTHPDYRAEGQGRIGVIEEGGTPKRLESRFLRADGSAVDVEVDAVLIEIGGEKAVLSVVRDISERKRAEEALRESERRLADAQRIGRIGHFHADLVTGRLEWSDELWRIYGLAREETELTVDFALTHMHPDDRGHYLRARDVAREERQSFSTEFRIVRPGGEIRIVTLESQPQFDDAGEVVEVFGTAQDITERKWAEQEVIEAKEAAEIADRAKSEFLANMSHELRTPLNAILGFAQMIEDQTLGPDARERYIQYAADIYGSGNHLLAIINDILDLSKIEAGKAELDEHDLDIDDLVESAVRLVRMRARETQLGLEVDVQVELAGIRLRADQRMVRQMLLNLLSNAVKFTPLGGSVTVSGRRNEDGGLALCVADTGIGMTPEDIPLALSHFGQVGRALDQSFEGTGLGLPLVRSLAELHGGGLEIESAVGVGTRATIWFPKERVVGGR